MDLSVLARNGLSLLNPTPTISDDSSLQFGTGGTVQLIYNTQDANANFLMLTTPEGGAIDVPGFVLGDATILNQDTGFFNGLTEPFFAVVNDAGNAYIKIDAGDDAVAGSKGIVFYAAGDEDIEILNLTNTTGTPRWFWDESDDRWSTAHGITFTAGNIVLPGSITIAPTAAGTFLDFQLETEWVSGTLINADFGSATTLNNDTTGMRLDFNTNVTLTSGKSLIIHRVDTPAHTQTTANVTYIDGIVIDGGSGALGQTTAAGSVTWQGAYIDMPAAVDNFAGSSINEYGIKIDMGDITETAGTMSAYGLHISGGTVTSGTETGVYLNSIDGNSIEIYQDSLTKSIVMRRSGVAHGMTDYDVTDAYGSICQYANTSGGLNIRGLKDADGLAGEALVLTGLLGEAADTTKSTSGHAVVQIQASVTDGGTGAQAVASGGNLVSILNSTTTEVLVGTGGELWIHGGLTTGGNTYYNNRLNYIGGDFTSGGVSTYFAGNILAGAIAGHSGDNDFGVGSYFAHQIALEVNNNYTAQAFFEEPVITGGYTPTVAATVIIRNQPSEGTTNAALYVVSGDSYLLGNVYAKYSYIFTDNAGSLAAPDTDSNYALIKARDNGVGLVEVARFSGAADPYFSMGGSQEFMFYYSGIATFAGNITTGNISISPSTDGQGSLGVQTTGQWGNVWSDLINGSDIMMANKWRMIESELYPDYPSGWALGHSNEWIDGKSLWKNPDMIGEEKPVFAVTDEFIEYKGRRITPEMLDKAIELIVLGN